MVIVTINFFFKYYSKGGGIAESVGEAIGRLLGRKGSSFDLEKFCPPCNWILLGIGILLIGFILFAIISITIKGIKRIISDREQVRTILGILSSLALFLLIIFVLPKCLRSEVNQLPKSRTTESSQNNLIKNIGKEHHHYWMHDDPENDIRIILEFFQDYFKMEYFSYSESDELRGPIRVDGGWNKIGDFEVEGRYVKGEISNDKDVELDGTELDTVINWCFTEDYKRMNNSKIEFVRLTKEPNVNEPNIIFDYPEIIIRNQTWMGKNLNVSSFRNGDRIQEAKTAEEWNRLGDSGTPAWCHYKNSHNNDEFHGKLYNWYAVSDKRVLAPNGWIIPSNMDWRELVNNLGGEEELGKKLKSNSDWIKNGNGDNSSGFKFRPSGVRYNGDFVLKGEFTTFWSYNEYDKNNGFVRNLAYDTNIFKESALEKHHGLSVRCMKYNN